MSNQPIFRSFAIAAILLCGLSAQAWAALDLGKVDEYKLKSFSEYFGQYFDVANTEFDDKEFESKLRDEAADINGWLANPANWPEEGKIKASMHADAGWLFSYFANAGLSGAHEQSVKHLAKASAADPKDYLIPLKLARLAAQKGDDSVKDVIRYAEKAFEADAEAAAKENLYFLLADAYYKNGDFAKALTAIKKQSEADSSFKNTDNLLFVLNFYAEKWGRVPERIVFKTTDEGSVRPEPADGE